MKRIFCVKFCRFRDKIKFIWDKKLPCCTLCANLATNSIEFVKKIRELIAKWKLKYLWNRRAVIYSTDKPIGTVLQYNYIPLIKESAFSRCIFIPELEL